MAVATACSLMGWVAPLPLSPICSPICRMVFLSCPCPRTDWQAFGNRHQNESDWWKFTVLLFLTPFDNRERRTCIYECALLFAEQKASTGNCYAYEQVLITVLLTKISNSAVIPESPLWTRTNLQLGQCLQNASRIGLGLLFTILRVLALIMTYSNINQNVF